MYIYVYIHVHIYTYIYTYIYIHQTIGTRRSGVSAHLKRHWRHKQLTMPTGTTTINADVKTRLRLHAKLVWHIGITWLCSAANEPVMCMKSPCIAWQKGWRVQIRCTYLHIICIWERLCVCVCVCVLCVYTTHTLYLYARVRFCACVCCHIARSISITWSRSIFISF